MITISILGLDQFVVGDYSREITKKIADAYEINEDEILFYAPQAFIFHKGFDQSAYNVVVKVEAERKYEVFEKIVFTIISKTLSKVATSTDGIIAFFTPYSDIKAIVLS